VVSIRPSSFKDYTYRVKTRRKFRERMRYQKLRDAGFVSVEADGLARVRSLNYIEIRRMMKTRQSMFNDFKMLASWESWSKARRKREWERTVIQWYREQGYLKHETVSGIKHAPWWAWFQAISDKLPEEQRYTALRRQRIRKRKNKLNMADRGRISKWINELTASIKAARDYETKRQFRLQRVKLRKLLE